MTYTLVAFGLTIVVWVWAMLWPTRRQDGDYDFGPAFSVGLRMVIACIATPSIWFIWVLLR